MPSRDAERIRDPPRAAALGQLLGIIRRSALWRLCRARHRRHTFVSHLMRYGVNPRAVQELAGHKDLSTSQRYMHLSPAAIQAAIRLLDTPVSEQVGGDILETENSGHSKLPC